MYQYKCKIVEVIDGDTVKVDIDVGFNIWMSNLVIRMLGIDSPESRTQDLIEKSFGLLSKKRLEELLPVNSTQIVQTTVDDKYGRILGDFIVNNESVSASLVRDAYAVPYNGQNKADVKALHELNRKKLEALGKLSKR
jgi:micrococcal nuclease